MLHAAAPASHEVVLRDGTTLHVRAVEASDEGALLEFLEGLSADSRAFRFMSLGVNLQAAARASARANGDGHVGLVAIGPAGEIVAHAMYVQISDDSAEVAFAVADAWQGHGLGTVLLGLAAEMANRGGILRFVALVRADNRRMIEVFRLSGFPVSVRARSGTIEVELPTALGEETLAAFADRDRVAATAAVRRFLLPRSVALIGASDRSGSVGAAVLRNLRTSFTGTLHLVNRRRSRVGGVPCLRSASELPMDVDLAVVAVPAASVAAVARACADRGIRALLVLSSGFEDGEHGAARRAELLAVCRRTGMRLIGPNCLGLVVTGEGREIDATFARSRPPGGPVALSTQSGGIAIAAIEAARARGLGFSSVVTIGDRLDLSTNDLLLYWESDEATRVIALYVESFGNPRNFARIARRVARHKPILAVKSGRAASGVRAAASHTAAMVAAKDISFDALFRQAGVIRTDTLRELLDTAALLAQQPLPAGPRVGIVTNAGGPAIMCADACEAAGLEVPALGERTRRRLRRRLRRAATITNPVDLLGDAPAERFRDAVQAVAADDVVDAVIVIFVPPFVTESGGVAEALAEAAPAMGGKPLLAVFLTEEQPPAALREARVPSFSFPEDAARSLAHAVGHRRWLAQAEPEREPLEPAPDHDRAAAAIAAALAAGGGWLDAGSIAELTAAYALPTVEPTQVRSAAEAVRVAASMSGPVALKAVAPGLVHKTDVGGVAVGLRGAASIRRAATRMRADVAAAGFQLTGFLVQPMAGKGVEMHVGVTADGLVGPLVACAAGGVTAELIDDVSVRVAPLEPGDPGEMVRELATFPLLDGYRGAPAADVGALEAVLRRVSALAVEHPAIAEIDCNPVVVDPHGAAIVDMRVRVTEPDGSATPLPGTRRTVVPADVS